jgi:hypothetical protein
MEPKEGSSTFILAKWEPSPWKDCSYLGGDCEECLLGYKNPVHTSQGTHYFFGTEISRLIKCKI